MLVRRPVLGAAAFLFALQILITPGAASAAPGGTMAPSGCGPDWSIVPAPTPGTSSSFHAVAAISPGDVWAVGWYFDGQAMYPLAEHWDGGSWTVVPTPSQPGALNAVSAAGPDDVWAVGSVDGGSIGPTLIEHWDGASWAVVPSPNGPMGQGALLGVAAVSATDAWAVGTTAPRHPNGVIRDLVEHWDGSAWSIAPRPKVPAGSSLEAASWNGTDLLTVGLELFRSGPTQPISARWDGSGWDRISTPVTTYGGSLAGVVSLSASDAWAVGIVYRRHERQHPLVVRYNGDSWTPYPVAVPADRLVALSGVAAHGPDDAVAVGAAIVKGQYAPETSIVHWDGSAWATVASPNQGTDGSSLRGVAMTGTDAWAVGWDLSGQTFEGLVERACGV